MKTLVLAMFLCGSSAFAAVHHTKAQVAYFAEHDKCVAALKAANGEAKASPPEERKARRVAAKESYRKCEHRAELVWKFYPKTPPTQ